MPIKIWKPQQYEAGFEYYPSGLDYSGKPCMSGAAAAPYDVDTLVREVTRYTGWTQAYYCDTGECEITIPAGQVQRADVQKGYMLEVDGDHFIIENYEWELTEEGYSCVIYGRDFGSRLDREIMTRRLVSGVVSENAGYLEGLIEDFFAVPVPMGGSANPFFKLPDWCGWFRNVTRKFYLDSLVKWEVPASFDRNTARTGGSLELVSYGAMLRHVAGLHDLGYRFDVSFDERINLHAIQAVLYQPEDQGVIIRSQDRGVSGFKYGYESRDSVNAALILCKSRYSASSPTVASEEPENVLYKMAYDKGGAVNWTEVANDWSGRVVDLGEVPSDKDIDYYYAYEWMEEQDAGRWVHDKETIAFSYDNSGLYKYGQHFGLGSKITVVDEFLNVAGSFRLHGVRKKYEAGKIVEYDFELGDKGVTQADKLLKRFSELDLKTYSV